MNDLEIMVEPQVEKTKFVPQPKRHERRKNIGQRRRLSITTEERSGPAKEAHARERKADPFVRLPGSRVPFKHAMALMDQMAVVIHKGLNPIDRQIELGMLPPYTSRGHGKARGRAAKANRIAAKKARYTYNPETKQAHYAPLDDKARRASHAQFKRQRIARRQQRAA
jgi:hypothetical protein